MDENSPILYETNSEYDHRCDQNTDFSLLCQSQAYQLRDIKLKANQSTFPV